MALVLNSKQFALYHQRLVERFQPTVLRGVHAGAQRAVAYLVERTRLARPANPSGIGSGGAVDTGAFIRGWRVLKNADGATIVNAVPHAPVVNYGRRPGSKMPPRAPLIAWIKRRLLTKSPTKRSPSKPRTKSDAVRERADEARREHGINGRPKRPKRPEDRRVKRPSSLDLQAARLYWPIAKAIARRGLLEREILTAYEARQTILALVEREVISELNREMRKL
jgi:hypothetical protein